MAAPRIDGSIQSNNTPGDSVERDFAIYRCQITRLYYVDDSENLSKGAPNPQLVYEAVVVGGTNDGRVFINVRDGVRASGGFTNYEETVLRPNQRPLALGKPNSQSPSQQFGDVVFIACLEGNPRFPVILGRGTHPLDTTQTGAAIADGPRKITEYNGVNTLIDKNGNWTMTLKGGTLDSAANTFAPTTNGKAIVETKNPTTGVMSIAFASGMTVTLDAGNDNVTILTKGGLALSVDGTNDAVTAQTKAGAMILADGKNDKVVAQDKEGARLRISGGKVGLGQGSNELLDLIDQLLQALQAETHLGNLGYPTSVPVNSTTYAAIQAKIDAIKGGI